MIGVPNVRKASSIVSFSVDITPLNVFDCFSVIPKNAPPSLVARLNAAVTMSAEIAPFSMSLRSSAMLLPVISEISRSGLKPASIIMFSSSPVSLPCD